MSFKKSNMVKLVHFQAQLPMGLKEPSGSCLKMPRNVSSSRVRCSTLLRSLSLSVANSITFCCVSTLRILALSLLFLTATLFRSLLNRYSLLFLSTCFFDLPLSLPTIIFKDPLDILFCWWCGLGTGVGGGVGWPGCRCIVVCAQ